MVGQRHVRTLGVGGAGLAAAAGPVDVLSVLRLGQSQVVGAVPLGAAGFGDVPQGCAVSAEPSAVCELRLLSGAAGVSL